MQDIGKYRGKRKDTREWAYGYYVKNGSVPYIYLNAVLSPQETDLLMYEVIPETVGEFADLHDKKAKRDLYGGDRVVIGKDRGVLIWDEFDLCWSLQIEDGEYQSICRFYSSEEIDAVEYLGNIHEEPN